MISSTSQALKIGSPSHGVCRSIASAFARTGSLQYRLHEPSLRLAIGVPILGESQCGGFFQGFVSPGVIRMGPEVVPK